MPDGLLSPGVSGARLRGAGPDPRPAPARGLPRQDPRPLVYPKADTSAEPGKAASFATSQPEFEAKGARSRGLVRLGAEQREIRREAGVHLSRSSATRRARWAWRIGPAIRRTPSARRISYVIGPDGRIFRASTRSTSRGTPRRFWKTFRAENALVEALRGRRELLRREFLARIRARRPSRTRSSDRPWPAQAGNQAVQVPRHEALFPFGHQVAHARQVERHDRNAGGHRLEDRALSLLGAEAVKRKASIER